MMPLANFEGFIIAALQAAEERAAERMRERADAELLRAAAETRVMLDRKKDATPTLTAIVESNITTLIEAAAAIRALPTDKET